MALSIRLPNDVEERLKSLSARELEATARASPKPCR